MGQVPYSLSFYDLLQFPLFRISAKQNDKEMMEKILWEAGMDVSQGYELVDCLHRAVTTNIPWYGTRVEGYERLDRGHLTSGIASLEAQLFTPDASLRSALLALDPRNAANKKKDFTEDSECSVEVYDEGCV